MVNNEHVAMNVAESLKGANLLRCLFKAWTGTLLGQPVTYTNFAIYYCPLKEKSHSVRLVIGRDSLDFAYGVSSHLDQAIFQQYDFQYRQRRQIYIS